MRRPEYISPSSLAKYLKDPDEWYLSYCADVRPPRYPQTQPMSVGSAFDAYAKSYMHQAIYGHFGKDNQFEFDAIFRTQVEEQHRDWALAAGKHCFDIYCETGAMRDLMTEVAKAVGDPRFEISMTAVVGKSASFEGVPILGKPDLLWRNAEGAPVIHDWKVNGFCSRSPVSPMQGYYKCREGGRFKMHKDCFPKMHRGMMINMMHRLEELNQEWAAQLATYGWTMGEKPGSEFLTQVDQLACKPNGTEKPEIRVATHRTRIGEAYQLEVLANYQKLWTAIKTGYIFTDMTREDNDAKCRMMDKRGTLYDGVTSGSKEDWLNQTTRPL